jgi:UDPglucose 6-dehydrogenase
MERVLARDTAVKLAVVGSGYVGLVTGTCFAESGNDVVCVDKDAAKIARLQAGEIPIYEPGLAELVRRNHRDGRLQFTTDLAAGIAEAELVFIAVGTPQGEDGGADLRGIWAVGAEIARHLNGPKTIVIKSTVPVGTNAELARRMAEATDEPFDVASNPEFLKEGRPSTTSTSPTASSSAPAGPRSPSGCTPSTPPSCAPIGRSWS